MIGIIDYGAGNLNSVVKAFEYLGAEARLVKTAASAEYADKLVLPGVGAFGAGMEALRRTGLDRVVLDFVAGGRPLLGICLGLHFLFERGYENGEFDGLGLIPGVVDRLNFKEGLKIPHMGWNTVAKRVSSPLFDGIPDGSHFYFVHSYRIKTEAEYVIGVTEYGEEIQCAAQRGKVYGVQFHPEKSGEIGLRMLKNFVELVK